MTNKRSPQLAVVGLATDVLDAAVRGVVARTATVLSDHDVGGEDAVAYLQELAGAVRARI